MKKVKRFGSLIIGAIFLYDFIITLSSNNVEQYEVIGLEVSKTPYLAYLLAIAVSFLIYGFTRQNEKSDSENQPISNSN